MGSGTDGEITFWVQIIANTGFPIAVTIYLLTSFSKTLGELKNAIQKLKQANKYTIK